jgi:hypothetical protein
LPLPHLTPCTRTHSTMCICRSKCKGRTQIPLSQPGSSSQKT